MPRAPTHRKRIGLHLALLSALGGISCRAGDDASRSPDSGPTGTDGGAGSGGSGGGGAGGGPVLVPGSGFAGVTAQPAPAGSGLGADKTAIAHWDVVPYVTFDGLFNVGVLSYHVADMARVEFSLNGGPWLAVHEPTLDPQTGVEEYWATVDASSVADGQLEIRAIAYPKTGVPRVLQGTPSSHRSSLFLNANAGETLPHEIRYASPSGSDTADCRTLATSCATLRGALDSAADQGSLDGAEIRLAAGNWQLPETGADFHTDAQWLTLTAAEDTDPGTVLITGIEGPDDGFGLAVKLVRLTGLTIVGPLNKASPSFEDYIWFDNGSIYNPNPNAIEQFECFAFGGYLTFTGTYMTNVYMDNMCNGPTNMTLARDVVAHRTAAGHASGTATVVNYTVEFVYGGIYLPGWPDYHGDVYQMYQRSEDIILYGAKTGQDTLTGSRGIVGSDSPIRDVAIVNADLDVTGGWVFSYCADVSGTLGPIDHMVVKDSRLIGASDWCGEAPGGLEVDPLGILNVLIDHSAFENGSPQQVPQPWDLPGIRYLPPIQ